MAFEVGLRQRRLQIVAAAEKLSALRTENYFGERAALGNVAKAKRIL